ncbi:MAG: lipase maturation factor family protein [Chloroflexi bacterium]|nr:lipase maturation factor family protein [Chloroflexota bacterium]MBV9892773.1 lipase maturation factor family protein [Chloroflexota bacterium]
MEWLAAPDYWLASWLFERLLAAIYVVAFLNAAQQFPALLGENGLLPAPRLLAAAHFRELPSLFHLHYSDRFVRALAYSCALIAVALLMGLPQSGPTWMAMATWFVLWAAYLSIVNVGQTFYAFGWESLLLETGFLAIFLGNATLPPPTPILWLLRWLLFRMEFGAGMIKIRHDPCWRDLTCLYYHHETQPLPNPLSWYFHHLPKWMHRMEVRGNHVFQLVVPFGLFLPQPVAGIAALLIVIHQLWLILSGNFAWLNWLTLAVAVVAFDNTELHLVLPLTIPPSEAAPLAYTVMLIASTLLLLVMSYWPARNLLRREQAMNSTYNPLHLVNSYGAFGSITRERNELAVEGTLDREVTPQTVWQEYAFKAKPGDPARWPAQVAPYHLRLDWLMWFAALSPAYAEAWLMPLVVKLLENDRPTLRLLRHAPFPDVRPEYIRISLYRYRFTTPRERRESRECWVRRRVGTYLAPVRLTPMPPQLVTSN